MSCTPCQQKAALAALGNALVGSANAAWLTASDILENGSGSADQSTAQSNEVQSLQDFLTASGWSVSGDSYGLYGPATQAAVADMQGQLGVASDGIVGPATRAAVVKALGGAMVAAQTAPAASSSGGFNPPAGFYTPVNYPAGVNTIQTATASSSKTTALVLAGIGVALLGFALIRK